MELLVSAVSIISLALNRMRVLSPKLLKRAASRALAGGGRADQTLPDL